MRRFAFWDCEQHKQILFVSDPVLCIQAMRNQCAYLKEIVTASERTVRCWRDDLLQVFAAEFAIAAEQLPFCIIAPTSFSSTVSWRRSGWKLLHGFQKDSRVFRTSYRLPVTFFAFPLSHSIPSSLLFIRIAEINQSSCHSKILSFFVITNHIDW